TEFISTFLRFAAVADLFIAGHFWSEGSPFLFTRNDVKSDHWKTKVIADISCDIDGPVATTIRSSTIESPLYGYNPQSESECAFDDAAGITVMAVDNLPCELPRDASEGFGKELMEHVFPLLIEGDGDGILQGATQTNFEGALNPQYAYLSSYAADGANQLDPD
ncbi:MAG: alanine dehydrogenase, partial [Flavobacteriales bacterium]